MPKVAYKDCTFQARTLALIQQSNQIIAEYQRQGLKLTLRQLYYQLVSRDIILNNLQSYNRLGNTINDARLAGYIDWSAIEDRTRALESVGHFNTPSDVISAAHNSYRVDKWNTQEYRPEVWIEKEALAGVFEQICVPLDVPYLSCRGYTSQSEMWGAAMRFVRYIKAGKKVIIFHFGDHDPSGIDMSRDIEDRLRMFVQHHVGKTTDVLEVKRIALNMNQVRQYDPPENPAKSSDTRFQSYQNEFGDSSWELDALNPTVLRGLVMDEILAIRDEDAWRDRLEYECQGRALLKVTSNEWSSIADHIDENYASIVSEEFEAEKAEAKIEDEDDDQE